MALAGLASGGAVCQDDPPRFDGSAGWIDTERHRLPEWQALTPDPNGYDVYARAWDLCEQQGLNDGLAEWIEAILEDTAPNAPAVLAALRAEAERHREALALLHEAGAMGYLAPSAESLTEPRPWLNSQRQMARLLIADAIGAYDAGDMDRAFGSLADAYAMSSRVGQGGALIDQLVSYALFGLCQRTQELFLRLGAAEAGVLAEHARVLQGLASQQDSFGVAVVVEGRAWLAFVDEVAQRTADMQAEGPPPGADGTPLGPAGVGVTPEDLRNTREWMEDRLARIAQAAEGPAVETHIHRLLERTAQDVAARQDPMGNLLVALGRTYEGHLATREGWVIAVLRPALEAYRERAGQWPPSLDELTPEIVPELPVEPWTGAPPLYRLDGEDGYVLYSPGFDGQDSGGEMSVLEGNRGPDIVLFPRRG